TSVGFGGVILFDAKGRLESKPYLFIVSEQTPTGNQWTEMGRLLLGLDISSPGPSSAPQYISTSQTSGGPLQMSQIGFILFDEPTFTAQNFTDGDPAVDSSVGTYA